MAEKRTVLRLLLIGLVVALAALAVFATTALAADGYTVYRDSSTSLWRAKADGATTNQSTDPIVYCLDSTAGQPGTDGITGYALTEDASDSAVASASASTQQADAGAIIRKILYYGYPTNADGGTAWNAAYVSLRGFDLPADTNFWQATQTAIWMVTNPGSGSSDLAGTALYNAATDSSVADPPSSFTLNLYTASAEHSGSQNFVNSSSVTPPSPSDVTITINKAWRQGADAFFGEHPEVTFSLYRGTDTTADPVDTATIAAGQTEGTDSATLTVPDDDASYTLVETLGAETAGSYSFAPAASQTIDLGEQDADFSVDVTNTVTTDTPEPTDLTVTINKAWRQGADAFSGEHPEVTFSLYRGSDTTAEPVATATIAAGQTDGTDSATLTLPDDDASYTLVETLGDETAGSYSFSPADSQTINLGEQDADFSVDVSNEVTPTTPVVSETTSVNVLKVWAEGISGESATIQLQQRASENDSWADVEGKTLVLTEADGWAGSFADLPKFASDGSEIHYGIREIADNYRIEYSVADDGTLVVTNFQSDETVSVPVEKKWTKGASGESAEIELYANGETTGQTLTLTEANGWKGTFSGLAKYDNAGKAIAYTVKENTSTWNFSIEEDGNGGFIVTNSPKAPVTISIPVEKRWAQGITGESATIVLTRNGIATDQTLVLTQENGWRGSFSGLPKYDARGNEIAYGVTEQTSNWNFTVTSDGNGGFIVTNSPKASPTSGNQVPRTGDSTNAGVMLALGVIGAAALAAGLRLRRN